jgi:hypothetical protein
VTSTTLGEVEVTRLDPPLAGASATETHVAVDPDNPTRMAAAAMLAPSVGDKRPPRTLGLWLSDDAGGSWTAHRVTYPRFDMEGAFDPLVAFAADGTVLVVGMAMPKRFTDTLGPGIYRRDSMPSAEDQMAEVMAFVEEHVWLDDITVARHGADGAQLGAVVVQGSQGADKPALAVDRHPGSPHHGTVYVAWHDSAVFGMLRVARSADDGRSFSEPVPLIEGPPWGNFISQLVVRPDGSLHVIWTTMVSTLPTAPPEAATSVWHAVSHDGGLTFSAPTAIARHAGLPLIGIPTASMAPDGSILVVLGQGHEVPEEPLVPVRHRLYGIRSADGVTWSEPALLCPDIPASRSMGLPAVACDGQDWWVLTYLADDEQTEVVLLRAPLTSETFRVEASLGRRPISVNDIYLHGGYQLIKCADVVRAGDYVGLAAHENRVTACFVLPETDDPMSTTCAYVAVLEGEQVR